MAVLKKAKVFARIRPLTGEEIKRQDEELHFQKTCVRNKKNGEQSYSLNVTQPANENDNDIEYVEVLGFTVPKSKPNKNKKFRKLAGVCKPEMSNQAFFEKAVAPLVEDTLKGETCCCFAYGHTGSGKTHTILGYGDDLGMYQQAAAKIFEAISSEKSTVCETALDNDVEELGIQVRFGELYNGNMYDLLNSSAKCFVREDENGVVNIRSETTVKENGDVEVHYLSSCFATTVEELTAIVQKGINARAVGNSDVHEHSSRSHAVLEFEIVNKQIIQERKQAIEALSALTTLGKEKDRIKLDIWHRDHKLTGELDKWVLVDDPQGPTQEESKRITYLENEIKIVQQRLDRLRISAEEMVSSGEPCIGGTFVFVDLAGSEHAANKTVSGDLRSDKEQQECREINKSLLSLKMCMQSLSRGEVRGPYRNSKLTMVLRDYLKAKNSKTVMIATLSPSIEHTKDTIHTLQYAQLVAGC